MENKKVKIIFTTAKMNGQLQQLYDNEISCNCIGVIDDALEQTVEELFDCEILYGEVCTAKKEIIIYSVTCTNNGYFLRKINSVENAFGIEDRQIKEEEEFNALFESEDDDEIEKILSDF